MSNAHDIGQIIKDARDHDDVGYIHTYAELAERIQEMIDDGRDALLASMERIRNHASAANSARVEYGCRGNPSDLKEAKSHDTEILRESLTACGWVEQSPGCWQASK